MTTRRWLITIFACLLVLAALGGYKFLQIKAAIAFGESFPEHSESVQALMVEESLGETYITTIGEIIAPRSLELRNELEGRVSAVNFESGSKVKSGDVMLQLDISEESARLKAAKASANLAKLKLERFETLLKNKTVSQENVDQAQAEFDIALATVNELQATIGKKTLKAPFDAVAGIHNIEAGEYLEANTAIVTLVGISDHLWVDFNLPLAQGSVAIGDPVKVALPGREDQQVTATVAARNPEVSAQSRNLRYRANIPSDSAIPPNSVVNVLVPTGARKQIDVPKPSVLRDEMGTYVFILDPEENSGAFRARRQAVTLGKEENQTLSVVEGLKDGDLVATHGAFKLGQKMLVYVRERPARDSDQQQGK